MKKSTSREKVELLRDAQVESKQYKKGETVEVSESTKKWLLKHNFAISVEQSEPKLKQKQT